MGWRDEEPDTFRVRAVRKTPKSMLCVFPDFGGDRDVEIFVPDTMVHPDSEVFDESHVGQTGKLCVNPWWTEVALKEHKDRKKADALKRAAAAGRVAAARKADENEGECVCIQCGVVLPDGVTKVWARRDPSLPTEPHCSQACVKLHLEG
jgi:hypothetical protein